MTITQFISSQTVHSDNVIQNTLQLIDQGCTIPFIARYRKEKTGGLDEVALEILINLQADYIAIQKRKETILISIEEQKAITPELRKKITSCFDKNKLEDLYLPYKKKLKTKGTKAKEAGLEPLAKIIMAHQNDDASNKANQFINQKVRSVEVAIQGAMDIIAEWITEYEWIRASLRYSYMNYATLTSKKKKTEHPDADKFQDFFDYSIKISNCNSHRLLAILRGEKENILQVKIRPDLERTLAYLEKKLVKGNGQNAKWVAQSLRQAYQKSLYPSLETATKNHYKEIADEAAIKIFSKNLKDLLLAPPLGEKCVMGIDPGFRSGCKVVCINGQGELQYNTKIHPHPPQNQSGAAEKEVQKLVKKYGIEAIAVGDGTAGRETLDFLENVQGIQELNIYLINENGASIYSASNIARQEFPDLDLTVRGAISIGRRLMDPLAELVKIDPKSIGVGQYQHDVNQIKLKSSLDKTVISCVNRVGINLNTASEHILTYVSGIGPTLAKSIVTYRSQHGPFTKRSDLLKVQKLGPKAYEQAAGFLRIRDAKNILDNTGVHPERYKLIDHMAKDSGADVPTFIQDRSLQQRVDMNKYVTGEVGMPTLLDILSELEKPGLDPRGVATNVSFHKNIKTIEDLAIGQSLPGIITNVTDFGAFVNIGIKENGLIHKSKISHTFAGHPMDVLRVNQEVLATVIDIDIKRKRIQLSLLDTNVNHGHS